MKYWNGYALAAIILAILAVSQGLIATIPAIFCGHLAFRELRRRERQYPRPSPQELEYEPDDHKTARLEEEREMENWRSVSWASLGTAYVVGLIQLAPLLLVPVVMKIVSTPYIHDMLQGQAFQGSGRDSRFTPESGGWSFDPEFAFSNLPEAGLTWLLYLLLMIGLIFGSVMLVIGILKSYRRYQHRRLVEMIEAQNRAR